MKKNLNTFELHMSETSVDGCFLYARSKWDNYKHFNYVAPNYQINPNSKLAKYRC